MSTRGSSHAACSAGSRSTAGMRSCSRAASALAAVVMIVHDGISGPSFGWAMHHSPANANGSPPGRRCRNGWRGCFGSSARCHSSQPSARIRQRVRESRASERHATFDLSLSSRALMSGRIPLSVAHDGARPQRIVTGRRCWSSSVTTARTSSVGQTFARPSASGGIGSAPKPNRPSRSAGVVVERV